MKTSKVLLSVVMLVVLSMLAACAAPAAAPTAAPAAQQPAAPAKAVGTAACAPNCTAKDLVLCYPQLGAESDWRTANTASFKETAAQLGIKQLIFSDAQQKQENQISAIRSCIQQGVNVIALPPVVETGWDAVLTEAIMPVSRSLSLTAPLRPIRPCMPRTSARTWWLKVNDRLNR